MFFSQGRKRKTAVFVLFAAFILIISQSRKMYLGIVLAILLYYLFISKSSINRQNNRAKFLGIIFLGIVGLLVMTQIPAFSFVFERVTKLLETFAGRASTDSSTAVRMELTDIGINLFNSNPLLGVGIGNPGLYAGKLFGYKSYYLHNNFVELLAGGGIVGTFLFYIVYIVIIYRYVRYRNFDDKQFNLCLTLVLIRLFFDYGAVSYSEKVVYVFIIILWLKSMELKRFNAKRR
ncbi:O-antigen ligase family protein [Blautia producta]|uniref:O-antigen ligase family protein n=1 Tax=Blautia producta TaxID=33035 RepID=UPI0035BE31C6